MCTGIRLIAENGAAVYGRTLEFGQETASNILILPRNHPCEGIAPGQTKGLSWQSRYAVVGANMLNLFEIVDGVNEKGLAGGLFYFPHYAEYQQISADQYEQSIAPWQLMTWILTNFATVVEVKQALPTINVTSVIFKPWGMTPPVHAIVHDLSGKSIVIEYVGGKLFVHDNPIGVITNSPTFDWHRTNLQNYLGLSAVNVGSLALDGVLLSPFGQGSGMFGLPGDFTPPSRFVRATFFSQSAVRAKTADEARDSAFHILNLFNIPIGVVAEKEDGLMRYDYTQWTSVSDLSNKRYYWHTYNNRQLCMVDLMNVDLNAPARIVPMHIPQTIFDVTR